MKMDIAREVAAMSRMTVKQLKGRYAEVFGEDSRSGNKDFLRKRIGWRLQALAEGDITERALRRAAELANDADLRVRAPRAPGEPEPSRTVTQQVSIGQSDRLPPPGGQITREYKGRDVVVTVRDKGFEYDGQVYRSLSAIAKVVTGSHWNGYLFFGITRDGGK